MNDKETLLKSAREDLKINTENIEYNKRVNTNSLNWIQEAIKNYNEKINKWIEIFAPFDYMKEKMEQIKFTNKRLIYLYKEKKEIEKKINKLL